MVPNMLLRFLHEFFNVTNGKPESERALKKYVDEVIIEGVNF
jgi:hypothetical protein